MKRKILSIFLATAMVCSSTVTALATEATDTEESAAVSGETAGQEQIEGVDGVEGETSDADIPKTEDVEVPEDDVNEIAETEPVSEELPESTEPVAEATAEDLYGKGYLFAIKEGVEVPTEDSGFSYLALNIYMADSKEQIFAYYSEDDLEYIEENSEMELLEDEIVEITEETETVVDSINDQYYQNQKAYLDSINAQAFWEAGVTGEGTTIAIIDSGLYSEHEDLDQTRIVEGYNYVKDNNDTKDTAGHGTQVAGVIAAVRNNGIGVSGLLDEVKIVPQRISADNSSSPTIAAASKAIIDAVDKYDVDVINMSVGQKAENEALEAAVKYAYEKNVILVAAAGNSGKEGEVSPLLYPAAYEEVIGVGAVDADKKVRENSQRNESVFVTAPGENIYSTDVNNRYATKSGTSYSAPIVAAMAAAAKEKKPEITVDEFKALLQTTSVDQGDEGYDISYGNGVVDVKTFLETVMETTIAEGDRDAEENVKNPTPDNGFAIQYKRAYGSTLTDAFSAVEATKDGGYIAVGYTFKESTDPVWDYVKTSDKTPNANNDAIMVKFDSEARIEWSKSFGTTGVDTLDDVTVLNDGTIVAVGRGPHDFGSGRTTASGYIVRIEARNPDEYEEIYIGGNAGDYLSGVTATKDGGYVVVGRTSSKDATGWTKTNGGSTTADGLLVKYDADGNQVFGVTYNNNDKRSYFYDVAEDADGNLIAVGDSQEMKFVYNSQIVKFNGSNGDVIWAKSEGSALKEVPLNSNEGHTSVFESVAVLGDGSYVVTGSTRTTGSTTGEEHNWGLVGERDGIVVHYGNDGTMLSAENIGTINGTVDLSAILATNDGGYMVYGQTSNVPEDSKKYDWYITGATDTLVIKYSADDTLEWDQTYGIEGKGVWFNDMVQNSDGSFFIVGESNWNSTDGLIDAGVWTSYLVEGDPAPGTVVETEEYELADGTFEGRARGFNEDEDVVVSVTITDGKIAGVELVSHADTRSYMNRAKALLTDVVEKNTYNVDTVTGATYSSRGLKRAVKNALEASAKKAAVKTYTISYELNGGRLTGTYPESFTSDMEQDVDLSAVVPKRTGYSFEGWFEDSEYLSKAVTSISAGTSDHVTLYAKWAEKSYTIKYNNVSGAKNTNPKTYTVNTDTIKLEKLSRTGYTFGGWYKDSKFKTRVKTIDTGSTGNRTLYAKWTANKYTVKFVGGSKTTGKMTNQTNFTYGKSVKLKANTFKKKGYVFKGWTTVKNGTKVKYKNKASVKNLTSKNKGTVTLYAVWKKK